MLAKSFFNNPIKLKRCTGLTIDQFTKLTQRIKPLWLQAEKHRLSRPDRKRAIGAGHPYGLKTMEEKLFCILLWYKVYPALWFLGLCVDLDAANVCNLINRLRPLVEQSADSYLGLYLKQANKEIKQKRKKISSWDDLKKYYPEAAEILIDATEQQRQRPKKRVQKRYYSGKKKRHTLKTQLAVSVNGKILSVSKSYPGRIHDFALLKKEQTAKNIPKESRSYLDGGYQGVKKEYYDLKMFTPFKTSRWHKLLNRKQKMFNRRLAKKRVKAEHVFAKLKKYHILSDIFRSNINHYNQDFRNVAALVNFRLSFSS